MNIASSIFNNLVKSHYSILRNDLRQEAKNWADKNYTLAIICLGILGPGLIALPVIFIHTFLGEHLNYQIVTNIIFSALIIGTQKVYFNSKIQHFDGLYIKCLPLDKIHYFSIKLLFQILSNNIFIAICFIAIAINSYAYWLGKQQIVVLQLICYMLVMLLTNVYLSRLNLIPQFVQLLILSAIGVITMLGLWWQLATVYFVLSIVFIIENKIKFITKPFYRGASFLLFLSCKQELFYTVILFILFNAAILLQLANIEYFIILISFLITFTMSNLYYKIINFFETYKKRVTTTIYLFFRNRVVQLLCILLILTHTLIFIQYFTYQIIPLKLIVFNIASTVLSLTFIIVNDKFRLPIQISILVIFFLLK